MKKIEREALHSYLTEGDAGHFAEPMRDGPTPEFLDQVAAFLNKEYSQPGRKKSKPARRVAEMQVAIMEAVRLEVWDRGYIMPRENAEFPESFFHTAAEALKLHSPVAFQKAYYRYAGTPQVQAYLAIFDQYRRDKSELPECIWIWAEGCIAIIDGIVECSITKGPFPH